MNTDNKISVLFCSKNSIYKSLDVSAYDYNRNALSCKNDSVIIAHPPCRSWGRLKHFANPRYGERKLTIWALMKINQNGGILEHPAGSSIWAKYSFLMQGGFVLDIKQLHFGHKAEKDTKLYIKGIHRADLPNYKILKTKPTHKLGGSRNTGNKELKSLHAALREATPPALAAWLIEVANLIAIEKQKNGLMSKGQLSLFSV